VAAEVGGLATVGDVADSAAVTAALDAAAPRTACRAS
jgi:hypothetical protein